VWCSEEVEGRRVARNAANSEVLVGFRGKARPAAVTRIHVTADSGQSAMARVALGLHNTL
jgi:hypothetical protein